MAASPALALPRLWRHEQIRGVAIQIAVLVLVFGGGAWLIGNVVANYAALDKTFGFSFLWRLPAGYNINQTLIDYTPADTHLRAALVGLLNTLLVSAVGIVLATVLGVAVGILRLSANWLVAKLAAAYVEATRNTPVLLLILLCHAILINSLPRPREAIALGGSVFLTNRGVFVPRPVFGDGIGWIAAAVLAGVAIAWVLRRRSRQRQARTTTWLLPGLAAAVILATIALAVTGMSAHLDRPALHGFNFRGGITLLPEFVALAWALALYTSGFIAEIVRAGILSVDRGQTEAARALGLPEREVLSRVVLPQALRVIVPPLTSEYLNLTKNSSLAIAIGYMDLMATLGGITLNQTGREMETMILVMAIYLVISLAIAGAMNRYNRRVRLVER